MDQQWVRGRRAKDIFLSPSEFAAASQAFRELQKRVPFVAQLIADGLTKKEICQRLKWSAQTLRYVLADFKLGFAKRDDVYRRILPKGIMKSICFTHYLGWDSSWYLTRKESSSWTP